MANEVDPVDGKPEPGDSTVVKAIYQFRLLVRDTLKGVGPIMASLASLAALAGSYAGYQAYRNAGHADDIKNVVVASAEATKAETAKAASEVEAKLLAKSIMTEKKLDDVHEAAKETSTKVDKLSTKMK